MTDRADEVQVCTRIFEECFRCGSDSDYALDILRAYGDERANAALEEARGACKKKANHHRSLGHLGEAYGCVMCEGAIFALKEKP